jgi:hypothetical protein
MWKASSHRDELYIHCEKTPVVFIRHCFDSVGHAETQEPGESCPFLKALAERIRALREAKGIPQEVFAYGAVERRQYSPTAINLAKIAVALEVEAGNCSHW